ncbi:MAG: rhodanese-like domain-containing protein [Deltaproteobacteria bacterium]|jgi:rhodanese-related sulfurtransferase|nr:rhodanese-like domain-containing protein [Deltaproteobacteria bacterium]
MLKNLLIVSAIALPLAVMGCKKASEDSDNQPAAAKPEVKAEPAKSDEKAEPKQVDPAKTAKSDPHEVEGVKGKLGPDEVDALLKDGKVHVFDANSDKTRSKYGVVPGAKLLTSYKDYDLGILPEDKAAKLVFYCSNLQCSAAGKGAKRAVVAGYSDVNLMPVGIMGWAEAGKEVKKL